MDNLAVLFDVECPVHMGPLEQGKILPCGHQICRSCLLFIRSRNRRTVGHSTALAAAGDWIVCPTCKKCADAGRLDDWPDGERSTMVGGSVDLGGKQRSKVQRTRSWSLRRTSSRSGEGCATVDEVVTELSTVESYCDEAVEKLDQMVVELIGMKAATVRMRNVLQDLDGSKAEQNGKQGVSTGEICTYVQKSISMLQNELFSELHNRLPKFFNAIDLYRDIDLPLVKMAPELAPQTEDIFQFASSLIFKLPKGDYSSMASSLAKFLQNVVGSDAPDSQPGGTWVVRCGRRNGYGDTHDDFATVDLGCTKIRACRCNRDLEQVPVNKTEMAEFVAEFLESQSDHSPVEPRFLDENLARKIKDRLEKETRLAWHCAVGFKDEFAVETGHPVKSMCAIEARNFRVIVWQG